MSLTLDEIRERMLSRYEIDELLELLKISAEELVDRFEDKLINVADDLEVDLE